MLANKKDVRQLMNQIDKQLTEIRTISQAEIDRLTDKIDSELNSCARELINAQRTLEQVKPLVDRLVAQVGANAPDAVQVLVGSIASEIMNKATGALDNLREVQKNVKDVDHLTDKIDEATDKIEGVVKGIDSLTDKYQN